jgi:hypothetical protein
MSGATALARTASRRASSTHSSACSSSYCQTLVDPDQSQTLLVFTAVPGSESYEKLQLLSVIGDQRI